MTRYARLKEDVEFYVVSSYDFNEKVCVPTGTIVEIELFAIKSYKLKYNEGIAFISQDNAKEHLEFLND